MNDNTAKGVAEFLLKEQELRIALEREATATRLEYYIPPTRKGRICTVVSILLSLVMAYLAFQHGDGLLFVSLVIIVTLFTEINRLERKMTAMQKLQDRKPPSADQNPGKPQYPEQSCADDKPKTSPGEERE